jgi:hypothetical protein
MIRKLFFITLVVGAAMLVTISSANAGPIIIDGLWYEFLFRTVGQPAEECPPSFCTPSPSGNSAFADSPPWTFTAPPGGGVLTVVDVAASGDAFDIFDSGELIGSTSPSATGSFCGLDPEICLQNPDFSQGQFELVEGEHSITIVPNASPFNIGAAYFKVASVNQPPNCDTAEPSLASLWPPNHSFEEITVGVTDPDEDPVTITIDGIFQDEIVDFVDEDGELTVPDGHGVGTNTAFVRAERNDDDGSDGRFYHIAFTANDGNGGACSSEVLVGVPRDQAGTLVDGGAIYDSTLVP